MRYAVSLLAVACAFAMGASSSSAQKIGFDDLPDNSIVPSGTGVSGGYYGFLWTNAYVISRDSAQARFGTGNGYVSGVVSPSNVMYNGFGDGGGIIKQGGGYFELFSIQLTSAFYDDEVAQFRGVTTGGQTLLKDVAITTIGPTRVDFGWTNLVSVSWYATSLISVTTRPGQAIMVFDDLFVGAPVPEPATWGLMLVGLGSVGLAMRRRSPLTAPWMPGQARHDEAGPYTRSTIIAGAIPPAAHIVTSP